MKNKKIIFFGTPYFAKEILANLLEKNITISLVITRPDKPVGRKKELHQSEVKKFAIKKNLPIKEFEKIESKELSFLQQKKPDIIVVAAFGMLFPKRLLDIPKHGTINIHPSLLPKYRGPSPIQTALLKGEKKTGTTIMLLDKEMDAGDILNQKKILIDPDDKYPDLEKKLIQLSNIILLPTLQKLLIGKIYPLKQDPSKKTYCKTISKSDGKIDWTKTAEKIYNMHRAFYSWPKIHTFWNRKKITLHNINFDPSIKNKNPGKIIKINNDIAINTKKGIIFPKELQLEGKKITDIKSFINGHPHFINSVLK